MSNPEVYQVKVWNGGATEWSQNGKLSRLDGPAIVYSDGTERWFIDGIEYTKTDWLYITQPKPVKELTVAEIEKLLGYRVKVVTETYSAYNKTK